MKQEILNYIKDCKEKGYEAETILKGLEVKLEIEKDTSENWERYFDESCGEFACPTMGGWDEEDVKDFIRKTREEAKEEGRKEGYDVGFCQGSSDTGLPNCLIDEYKKQSKSELIDGLIEWAEKKRDELPIQAGLVMTDLIHHLKNLKI